MECVRYVALALDLPYLALIVLVENSTMQNAQKDITFK